MDQHPLTRMAAELRETNQPGGFKSQPDIAWQEAPPGKTLAEMTADQQRLALVAVEGLAAHLRGKHQAVRAGSPAYHEIGRLVGIATVTADQLRRWIAAHDNQVS